ncbi:hypothetical protein K438DRAFT_376430 [Mycena galopus ATCC 62051]|nr:hypothetical protein K438DRAFT_376430 [Mycena galopus ATCC 62051]
MPSSTEMGKSEQPTREIFQSTAPGLSGYLRMTWSCLLNVTRTPPTPDAHLILTASWQLHEDGNAPLRSIKQSRAQNTHLHRSLGGFSTTTTSSTSLEPTIALAALGSNSIPKHHRNRPRPHPQQRTRSKRNSARGSGWAWAWTWTGKPRHDEYDDRRVRRIARGARARRRCHREKLAAYDIQYKKYGELPSLFSVLAPVNSCTVQSATVPKRCEPPPPIPSHRSSQPIFPMTTATSPEVR